MAWLLVSPNEPISDQRVYHVGAQTLAAGRGFLTEIGGPQGYWPVGYPAALAPFYRVLGDGPRSAHLANLLLGLALVAGAHRLARELFGERAAVRAALVTAVYPTWVMLTSVLASENLALPLGVWAAWAFARAVRAAPRPRAAAAFCAGGGLLVGLAAYARAPALLVVGAFPVLAWTSRWPLRRVLRLSALAAGVALLTVLPWGFRNQAQFGSFQPLSMNGGANLWMGNHPGSDGGYAPLPHEVINLPLRVREARLRDEALETIRSHPLDYLLRCARRLGASLRSDTIAVVWNETGIAAHLGPAAARPLKVLCSGAWLACVLWLALSLGRRRGELGAADAFLAALVALCALPFVLIVGGNRYALPIVPFVQVWAASAAPPLAGLARRLRRSGGSGSGAAGA